MLYQRSRAHSRTPTTTLTPQKNPSEPDIQTRMTPPLPIVQNDTALGIFAHTSVRSPEQDDRVTRLAFLGEKVLHMVTAETLFEKKPMLDTAALNTEFESALADTSNFYEQWVSYYKLREKVACAPDHRGELEEPETTQQLFDAYVGAVYSEKGYSSTKAWIQPLVDPNFISTPNGSSTGASTESSPPTISILKDSSLSGAFLAAFNQTAAKHRVEIQWNGVQSGPPHSPTWKIECISGGVVRGTGVGKNKQEAKEEAARQAHQALGWVRIG